MSRAPRSLASSSACATRWASASIAAASRRSEAAFSAKDSASSLARFAAASFPSIVASRCSSCALLDVKDSICALASRSRLLAAASCVESSSYRAAAFPSSTAICFSRLERSASLGPISSSLRSSSAFWSARASSRSFSRADVIPATSASAAALARRAFASATLASASALAFSASASCVAALLSRSIASVRSLMALARSCSSASRVE